MQAGRTSILTAVLLGALLAQAPAHGAEKRLWAKSVLNQKAPELVVEKWLTPKPETRGKFVLVEFWATWCGPCRQSIPELNAISRKFADKLVVIGVSDEDEQTVRNFASPRPVYAIAIDGQARMKKQLAVTGIPHAILVDPQGIVRWEGFPLLDGYALTPEVVDQILRQPAP